jgi:hypothetical protein
MADVSATLRAWSATAASNSPTGGTVIGAGLDDNLRQIQATVRQFLASQGTNMVSAATVDLSTADGFYVVITGTTAITALGTEGAGIGYLLKFNGVLTFTHNATSLILPGGANITTASGDLAWMISEGAGNWRCVQYSKATGLSPRATQPTRQVLTSGAAATYTTPTNATRINVRLVGGGGGGGGGTANAGTAGNNTTFSTLTGGGGTAGTTAGGGAVAGGTATGGDINIPGGAGQGGQQTNVANVLLAGGNGGTSVFGGGGTGQAASAGSNGATNSGGGGGGGGGNATNTGGGGGAGGYVEKLFLAPAATYLYTVGAAANGGAAGTFAGGNGAAGIIIVDEYYN